MATTTTRQAATKLGIMGRQASPSRMNLPSRPSQTSPLPSHRPTPSPLAAQEITIPPVFDIFDAPVRLRRERSASQSPSTSQSLSPSSFPISFHLKAPTAITLSSSDESLRQSRSSLPKPIVFDGPSRPPPLVRDSRDNAKQPSRSAHPHHTHHTRSTSAPPSKPDQGICSCHSTVQVFDGPARRHYSKDSRTAHSRSGGSSTTSKDSSRRVALVAGTLAIGAAASAVAVSAQ